MKSRKGRKYQSEKMMGGSGRMVGFMEEKGIAGLGLGVADWVAVGKAFEEKAL